MTHPDHTPCPIDHEHLTDMSGGDVEFETELMQEFLRVTPPLLHALAEAVEQGEIDKVEHTAHAIKGSCRSLGARPMSDPCEALERDARVGDLRQGPSRLQEIDACFSALRSYIEQTWKVRAA